MKVTKNANRRSLHESPRRPEALTVRNPPYSQPFSQTRGLLHVLYFLFFTSLFQTNFISSCNVRALKVFERRAQRYDAGRRRRSGPDGHAGCSQFSSWREQSDCGLLSWNVNKDVLSPLIFTTKQELHMKLWTSLLVSPPLLCMSRLYQGLVFVSLLLFF